MRTLLALLVIAVSARGADLMTELKRGPLVQVETGKDGKFAQATCLAVIDAPPARVWTVITDFAGYAQYMPKLTKSVPKQVAPNEVEVEIELDNPGPDTSYTVHQDLDPAGLRMMGRQVAGDLKGSTWSWVLEAVGNGQTLARYTGSVKNFSSLAESLEDEQQTVTVGINVGSVIAAMRAVKTRAEGKK